ncbi:hypothetical protein EVAR_83365_1 [Eumeta japonica]|uniref:Uncharacterized protein n=1 Tax=Eumeta variegata TaxID=151549 RepID=A0A4C1TYA5_EUMVA|nr:hypothetical protein EVAR_83365_1 [Eumeta japonica]
MIRLDRGARFDRSPATKRDPVLRLSISCINLLMLTYKIYFGGRARRADGIGKVVGDGGTDKAENSALCEASTKYRTRRPEERDDIILKA